MSCIVSLLAGVALGWMIATDNQKAAVVKDVMWRGLVATKRVVLSLLKR